MTDQVSRRHLLRWSGLSIGVGLIGTSMVGTSMAAAQRAPSGEGEDGAPGGDSRFGGAATGPVLTPNATVVTSYNGWPIGTPGSVIGVTSFTVPGTSIHLLLKSGDVATVLLYVAQRFDADVQRLDASQVGGYEYRRNVNNPTVWSNHASGTAIDLNSELHPNGAKHTFTPAQVAAIHDIGRFCGGVVFWGGDYTGTTDEMHFEINVRPDDPTLPALAKRIRAGAGLRPGVTLLAAINGRLVTAENAGAAPLIANRTAIGDWETFDVVTLAGAKIALRAHANDLFVCADHAGRLPLIANRTTAGPWESFSVLQHSDGTVSLRAAVNGRFVTADHAGSLPLIANRSTAGPWEKFQLSGA